MDTTSGTVTVWQSGRLAPHAATRRFEWGREQWLLAGLLVLSAIVFTLYVVVLERDVDSGELQHAVQRSRAVAEARCETDQPALRRGRCIALLNGDAVALDAAPVDHTAVDSTYALENAARATTLSLMATR